MKVGLVVIICFVIQQNTASCQMGQNLQELLKDAQYQTDELHSLITSVLLKYRMEMSNILTGIVNESLSNLLKPLESSQLDDNESASDELDSESEQIGKQISRCSAQADSDIQAAIKQFYFVFNPIQSESFTVLNTVVEQIVEWNHTSEPSSIVDRVHDLLKAKNNEFVANIVPLLDDELRKFKSILLLFPASVSRCVNETLTN